MSQKVTVSNIMSVSCQFSEPLYIVFQHIDSFPIAHVLRCGLSSAPRRAPHLLWVVKWVQHHGQLSLSCCSILRCEFSTMNSSQSDSAVSWFLSPAPFTEQHLLYSVVWVQHHRQLPGSFCYLCCSVGSGPRITSTSLNVYGLKQTALSLSCGALMTYNTIFLDLAAKL